MPTLAFQFNLDVTNEQRNGFLSKLLKISGVEHLNQVDSSSQHPLIERMYMIQLTNADCIEQLKAELAQMPVNNVEEQPERVLID